MLKILVLLFALVCSFSLDQLARSSEPGGPFQGERPTPLPAQGQLIHKIHNTRATIAPMEGVRLREEITNLGPTIVGPLPRLEYIELSLKCPLSDEFTGMTNSITPGFFSRGIALGFPQDSFTPIILCDKGTVSLQVCEITRWKDGKCLFTFELPGKYLLRAAYRIPLEAGYAGKKLALESEPVEIVVRDFTTEEKALQEDLKNCAHLIMAYTPDTPSKPYWKQFQAVFVAKVPNALESVKRIADSKTVYSKYAKHFLAKCYFTGLEVEGKSMVDKDLKQALSLANEVLEDREFVFAPEADFLRAQCGTDSDGALKQAVIRWHDTLEASEYLFHTRRDVPWKAVWDQGNAVLKALDQK